MGEGDEPGGVLGDSLGGFLAEMAGDAAAPGGGSAAAVCVAMAAGLVASVARLSRADWAGAGAAVAQAEQLRSRVAPLVELDARAFDEALRTLAARGQIAESERDSRLERALSRAAEVPQEIAEVAADVGELAVLVAGHGNPQVQADGVAAATLAEAAARTAASLVEVNLTTTEEDARVMAARECVSRAEASRERAVAGRPA